MKKNNYLAVGLLVIHAVFGMHAIKKNSQTYDEAVHLAAGYSYLKSGRFEMNILDHPPFVKLLAAAPLLFTGLDFLPKSHPLMQDMQGNQYYIADHFMFHNRIGAGNILTAGRIPMLFLSIILAFSIFAATKRLTGNLTAGVSALFLYVFYSATTANGILITTDAAVTLFYFLSVFFLYLFFTESKTSDAILFGVFFGLSLASKFSSVLFPPVYLLFALYFRGLKLFRVKELSKLTLAFLIAIVVLWSTYFFEPLSLFYDGLNHLLRATSERPRAAFLMGEHSIGGWRHYFVATMLFKTPLPLIFLAIYSLFIKKYSKLRFFLLTPVIFFLLASSFSKVQIGHRHILPVYPFILLGAGIALSELFSGAVFKKVLAIILSLWVAAEYLSVHPWHISYFNQLAGGPKSGHMFLLDSNTDWGQGLGELAAYLRKHNTDGIYFSYFGTGDPSYHGIRYFPIGFVSNLDRVRTGEPFDVESQPRRLLAVSATNLHAKYFADKEIFRWLMNEEPEAQIAYSIFVYDLEKESVRVGLVELFRSLGNDEEAERLSALSRL